MSAINLEPSDFDASRFAGGETLRGEVDGLDGGKFVDSHRLVAKNSVSSAAPSSSSTP